MKKNHRAVYTPQMNEESIFLLRRVAWAAEQPMTLTLDACVLSLTEQLDRDHLCQSCRDRRCNECPMAADRFPESSISGLLK